MNSIRIYVTFCNIVQHLPTHCLIELFWATPSGRAIRHSASLRPCGQPPDGRLGYYPCCGQHRSDTALVALKSPSEPPIRPASTQPAVPPALRDAPPVRPLQTHAPAPVAVSLRRALASSGVRAPFLRPNPRLRGVCSFAPRRPGPLPTAPLKRVPALQPRRQPTAPPARSLASHPQNPTHARQRAGPTRASRPGAGRRFHSLPSRRDAALRPFVA